MSMPSSRLEVATTAGRRPALRSSSTRARCSLETEPWWARAITAGAPWAAPEPPMSSAGEWCSSRGSPVARSYAISLSLLHRRSARRRELAKTIVERCDWTRSVIRSSTCGQIDGRSAPSLPSATGEPPSSPRSSTGTTTDRSNSLPESGWTISTLPRGARNRATSSTGRTVADRPMRRAGFGSSSSSRSRVSARWAPRLVPATACTSSRMTVSMPVSASRVADVSIRNRDSGVVIRMSGGRVDRARRSAAGVSPERMPTLTSGSGRPRRTDSWRMPVRGLRRLRSTSTARALSGETYRTRQRFLGSAGGGVEASWSRAARKAASVLPEPVGATTSTSEPSEMACHAPAWAAVGAEKAPVNQPRVAGEKPSRARCAELTMDPSCTRALTIGLSWTDAGRNSGTARP